MIDSHSVEFQSLERLDYSVRADLESENSNWDNCLIDELVNRKMNMNLDYSLVEYQSLLELHIHSLDDHVLHIESM